MLRAMQANLGCVSKAAADAEITKQTHYNWYKNDEVYRESIDNIKYESYEEFRDLVFNAVLKKVNEGDTAVINRCFFTLFNKMTEQMTNDNTYRPRLTAKFNYINKPENGTQD